MCGMGSFALKERCRLLYYLALPFIGLYSYPKWGSEVECVGFGKCTPMGGVLRSIAGALGFLGGMLLIVGLAVPMFSRERIICDKPLFSPLDIKILCVSVVMGLAGWILYGVSQWLAARRGFEYDVKSNTVSWDENGERVTYDYEQWLKDG